MMAGGRCATTVGGRRRHSAKKRSTRKGQVRVTARRAYMKTAASKKSKHLKKRKSKKH